MSHIQYFFHLIDTYKDTLELAQHPMLGSIESLEMFLGTAVRLTKEMRKIQTSICISIGNVSERYKYRILNNDETNENSLVDILFFLIDMDITCVSCRK